METVLTAFIILTLLLFAAGTLFEGYLTAQDTIQVSWQEMEERLGTQARTSLVAIDAQTQSSGSVVELTLRNDGSTKLTDFDQWDLIIQHYSASSTYAINWLPYVAGEPSNNEWSVVGIYMDAAGLIPEVFEPGILNPGEEMVVRARVQPPVGPSSTNLAALSTGNGVGVTAVFTR
jgi:archaellum component FlaF (FlaF/FlaG flagellin family)